MPDYLPSDSQGLVASPELTTRSFDKPRQAVPTEEQAKGIVEQLVLSNRRRHTISARILGKLNAERPYDHAKLEAEGLGWKHNFSTKPLSALVDRVAPRFVDVVNGVKFLTPARNFPRSSPTPPAKRKLSGASSPSWSVAGASGRGCSTCLPSTTFFSAIR
jgi:hypothetical protein